MAFNGYIQVKDIDGECQDGNHQKWIALLGIDFGVDLPVLSDRCVGGSATTNRANFSPITITKELDKASPKLYDACACATTIDKCTVEICRSLKGTVKPVIKIELEKVYVTMVDTICSADVHRVPLEIVQLNYGTIKWTYTQSDLEKGSFGGTTEFGWDVSKNKKK